MPQHRDMRRLIIVLAMLLFCACSGDENKGKELQRRVEGEKGATPRASAGQPDVWNSAVRNVPPTCNEQCVELAKLPVAHGAGDAQVDILFDPRMDDPITRWGDCLGDFMRCWLRDGSPAECVARSNCPQACKNMYASRTGGDANIERQLAAFEAVFINNDDAVCLPEARGEVTP
jgi:hypothetical protein